MIMSKIALDTNILIFLHDAVEVSPKRAKANELIANRLVGIRYFIRLFNFVFRRYATQPNC
jgi:hypothetical protein